MGAVGPLESPQPWSVGVAFVCLDGAVVVKWGAPATVALLGPWIVGVVAGYARLIGVVTPPDPVLSVVDVAGVMLEASRRVR